jgi:hypothetical protein
MDERVGPVKVCPGERLGNRMRVGEKDAWEQLGSVSYSSSE